MSERSAWPTIVTLLGAGLLVLGTYLPWAYRAGAGITTTSFDAVENFDRGIEIATLSYDVVVVGAATLAVIAVGFTTRPHLRGVLSGVAGGLAVGVSVEFLVTSTVDLTGVWVPDLGWYLTVVGGVVLLVHGANQADLLPTGYLRGASGAE